MDWRECFPIGVFRNTSGKGQWSMTGGKKGGVGKRKVGKVAPEFVGEQESERCRRRQMSHQ